MNHFYLVVCFINIFVFSVKSAPTATTSNIFDLIQNYTAKNCPALNKNVLIDKNMTYLSRCRDVSLEKVPAGIAFDSMNAYLCVGILEADFRLCSALSNETYTGLAKSYEDLRESIDNVRINSADKLCTEIKKVPSTFNYSSDIRVKLSPWMSKFNEQLLGPGCSFLCSDFGQKSNVFCSLLLYINAHIQNVQRVIQQRRMPTVPVISLAPPNVPVKSTTIDNVKTDNVVSASLPLGKSKHNQAPAPQAANVNTNVEQQIKPKTEPTNTTTETTSSTKLHDPVGGDKKKESQSQTKTVVVLHQDVQKAPAILPAPIAVQPVLDKVDKEPAVTGEKPKESDQPAEKEKIDEKLHSVVAQNSAPETERVASENKLETPETKEESVATNKNAATETTDKVENGIFDTTVATELKELKQENYFDDDDDANFKEDDAPGPNKEQESAVPVISDQSITPREYADVEDSNFFAYFMFISVMFIAGYVVYHNKQKILALVLEGRRDRNARRRPNTASYRKLNSNLEEAVTSKCSGSAAHVIY